MLYSVISFLTADVRNKIYEAGLLKDNETVLIVVDNCALLEYFTGKSYSYRAVNNHDLKSKFMFSRRTPLPKDKYNQTAEKMLQSVVNYLPEAAERLTRDKRETDLLSYIFTGILPRHGMTFREMQYELAMDILRGLQSGKLMLCEAGVGTGKTHSHPLRFAIRAVSCLVSICTTARYVCWTYIMGFPLAHNKGQGLVYNFVFY